jgi:hypothetical protein
VEFRVGAPSVKEAINAVLRAQTFREQPTSLTRRILQKISGNSTDDYCGVIRQEFSWDSFKEICPIVFEKPMPEMVAANILRCR